MADYTLRLERDLLTQFRDQPNISVLIRALGKQMQQLEDFFLQLRDQRGVETAAGTQLDRVGDIEVLSRVEAGLLAGDPIPVDVLDDETYRRFLVWKILKNATHTAYPDIIRAFRMFWDRPLYYREDPAEPATMIFDTGEMEGPVDTTPLFLTPPIRAAGVKLKLYATTRTGLEDTAPQVGAGLGRGVNVTELPSLERTLPCDASLTAGSCVWSVMETIVR